VTTRRPAFTLVPDSISHDTVEALRVLHEQATEGKIVGVAFTAMYRGRYFIANSTGECYRNPIFSAGMVWMLLDKLRHLARHGTED
jgi:hypothetical protein